VQYEVTGIIGNMVLLNAGFPQAKESLGKFRTIWAGALTTPKILKNIGLKGHQTFRLPAEPTYIGPALFMTLNIKRRAKLL
jgi:hypothetical protein